MAPIITSVRSFLSAASLWACERADSFLPDHFLAFHSATQHSSADLCLASTSPAQGAEAFKFPFQPYAVQLQLMSAVYDTLTEGDVGIFESPTGTGKSLSIICSSLRRGSEPLLYMLL